MIVMYYALNIGDQFKFFFRYLYALGIADHVKVFRFLDL